MKQPLGEIKMNEVKSKNGKSLFKIRPKVYREENEDCSDFLKSVGTIDSGANSVYCLTD